MNAVVRVGDTVRRSPPPNAEFVHELLTLFERRGWAGAPRFLGSDEQGREVLSFIDGHVPWEDGQALEPMPEPCLVRVAELVREFHDLTAETALAGGNEVVCHNDLSPKNTVYRNLGGGSQPIAFIDWDLAAPGARIHDVAHVCWQYVNLGPGAPDVASTARLLRLVCDAYGLANRSALVETILWWQDRCWRGIEAAAATGDAAMIRLRDDGALRAIQEAYAWVAAHRLELEAAMR